MIIATHSSDAKQLWAWVVAEAGWWHGQQKNSRWHRVAHGITFGEGLMLPEVWVIFLRDHSLYSPTLHLLHYFKFSCISVLNLASQENYFIGAYQMETGTYASGSMNTYVSVIVENINNQFRVTHVMIDHFNSKVSGGL